jgi:RNA polymerase sigma-70 factor (ECF subfamily)
MEQHAMLKPMPSDFADPAESSTETVARALAALTRSELLRLKRVAHLRAPADPGSRVGRVVERGSVARPDGSRRWPEGVPLLAFIAGIMRSLVDGRAQERRRLAERALAVGQTSAAPAPDARLHARQCLAAIAKFFAGDPDVLALIAALAQQHLGCVDNPAPRLGKKRCEAARKRLARAILRGQLDGFLP